MSDKKEILDYLRNLQKAQEIDAKVKGINIWVLLGALALVLWQLIATLNTPIWLQNTLVLRTLILSEAAYLLMWFAGGRLHAVHEEIRYKSDDKESTFESFLEALIFLTPTGLFVLLVERSWSAIVLLIFGIMLTVNAVDSIVSNLFKESEKKRKFPKTLFGPTKLKKARISCVYFVLFMVITVDQALQLSRELSSASVDSLKVLTLLAAAFLLLLTTMHHKLRTAAILWTYEMEAGLVVGSISAEVALSRIEYRALGQRMNDVMEEFYKDVDTRFSVLPNMISFCKERLALVISSVPLEFQAERSSQITKIAASSKAHLEKLQLDIAEFGEYIKELALPNKARSHPDLLLQIDTLKHKHAGYESRAASEKNTLESLITSAQSLISPKAKAKPKLEV